VRPASSLFPTATPKCAGGTEELRRWFFGKEKPNFAGEWIVHSCTCGSGCGYPFMWNARTGEVYRAFPFDSVNAGPPWTGWRGLVHTASSRLLIAEGYIGEGEGEGEGEGDSPTRFPGTRFYLWNGRRFVLLSQVALPAPGNGPAYRSRR